MEFGLIEMSISQFALEQAVTEGMTVRRAVGQTDDEACNLPLVAALAEFGMFVVQVGRTLVENDG